MQVSGIYNHPKLGTLPLFDVEQLNSSQFIVCKLAMLQPLTFMWFKQTSGRPCLSEVLECPEKNGL